ncbi:MAG: flagellar basal body rod protein FlgB [Lachnospiraceae bacterium]|nr:flagellar basal body rod protein FlgB [Lachnospiraceae bacterium]
MITSNAFNYINVLDKAADASYKRETIIANNIANADTPNYKRKDIEFSDVLEKKLLSTQYTDINDAVRNVDTSKLVGKQYTDYAGYSYRIDGNNVDIDTENVELASEQLRYQTEIQSVTMDFTRLKSVIK